MFRIVDRPLSFRQRASEWIYKMLFLWSREAAPGRRAGPWFAWFATAVLLWRCRRRIAGAILAVSPLRLVTRRAPTAVAPVLAKASSTGEATAKQLRRRKRRAGLASQRKHKTTGIGTRVKRLCNGDGPHVSSTTSTTEASQRIDYRVTRSGRVYGKYPNKIVSLTVSPNDR